MRVSNECAQALIIVDVQNDFTPTDGALAVPHGDEVIAAINELAASVDFALVIATRDWHPPDHASFRSQSGVWPRHCCATRLEPSSIRRSTEARSIRSSTRAHPGQLPATRPSNPRRCARC